MLPTFVQAIEFEEGQQYCVGDVSRVCESILEVKHGLKDGYVFEETWRMYAPISYQYIRRETSIYREAD